MKMEELIVESSDTDAQHHDFIMGLFNDGLVPTVVMHDASVPDAIH
jgi:hypothetical protein